MVFYFAIIVSCGVMWTVEELGYNLEWLSFTVVCRIAGHTIVRGLILVVYIFNKSGRGYSIQRGYKQGSLNLVVAKLCY